MAQSTKMLGSNPIHAFILLTFTNCFAIKKGYQMDSFKKLSKWMFPKVLFPLNCTVLKNSVMHKELLGRDSLNLWQTWMNLGGKNGRQPFRSSSWHWKIPSLRESLRTLKITFRLYRSFSSMVQYLVPVQQKARLAFCLVFLFIKPPCSFLLIDAVHK